MDSPNCTLCTLGRVIASGFCLCDAHCLGNDVRKEMRKPGRPLYVSRREEKKKEKIIEMFFKLLAINTALCVFLDLFY